MSSGIGRNSLNFDLRSVLACSGTIPAKRSDGYVDKDLLRAASIISSGVIQARRYITLSLAQCRGGGSSV